ncbi:phosphoesterase, MJ0936 family [Halobacteroides halobius DSM 5150]|uniref:Phosphoesterase n=1 Tax=Halobacteroides halobius (strain ATCC 35273 / DSM 5150 / MD-1) TaxID=748449 RepID=L0KCI2_HALHC|nr:metallophosphoesterase family protein [Halobacteroides halobius]AGB42089.1 phosphoesterase, MJ0936 family [Halobacteroides halobius DSM 5150]
MRLAIISDIHSNIYALEEVLEDIKGRKVTQIVCAGDLVGYNPFPNQVIERIQEEEIKTVQGNYDDAIGNNRIACGCDYKTEKAKKIGLNSIQFSSTETTEENKEFLSNLSQELKLELADYEVLLVHGSPRRLNEYLYADSEQVKEVTVELEADILLCGHTHQPYHKIINDKHVINVGSIGKPKHGNPNAVYTILEIKNKQVKTEFIEVPYPVDKVTAKIKETDLADESIELLEQGIG